MSDNQIEENDYVGISDHGEDDEEAHLEFKTEVDFNYQYQQLSDSALLHGRTVFKEREDKIQVM